MTGRASDLARKARLNLLPSFDQKQWKNIVELSFVPGCRPRDQWLLFVSGVRRDAYVRFRHLSKLSLHTDDCDQLDECSDTSNRLRIIDIRCSDIVRRRCAQQA